MLILERSELVLARPPRRALGLRALRECCVDPCCIACHTGSLSKLDAVHMCFKSDTVRTSNAFQEAEVACTVVVMCFGSLGKALANKVFISVWSPSSNRTHSRPNPPFQNGKYPLNTLELLGLGALFLDIMEIGTARHCRACSLLRAWR
jgi:hypothetical protein